MPVWLRALLPFLLLIPGGPVLHAQTWPSKPIRIIVPFAPGGPADLLPRLGGEFLKLMAGIAIVHVPCNGTAPALLRTESAHYAGNVKRANVKAE